MVTSVRMAKGEFDLVRLIFRARTALLLPHYQASLLLNHLLKLQKQHHLFQMYRRQQNMALILT